jgi:hypothetical protein
MLNRHDDRTITANVDEVLEALRNNLAEHKKIVAEAKDGYKEACKKALVKARSDLSKRLKALEAGEPVNMRGISFHEAPPQDHSKQFDTIIKMLELHKNSHVPTKEDPVATIDLKAVDVQQFVLNNWDWSDQFLVANAAYSATSFAVANEKGLV